MPDFRHLGKGHCSFVMSVRVHRRSSLWTDFPLIRDRGLFNNCVEAHATWLQSDSNIGHCTQRSKHGFFFPHVALRPNASQDLLIHEVSRSHTTHHSRYDSSGRVIRSSQRPLPDNTRHSQQTNIHAPGGIRTQDLSRRAAGPLACCRECRVLSETSRMGAPYIYDISHLRFNAVVSS